MNYYAIKSSTGSNFKEVITFNSKLERDEYVNTTDYTDAVTVAWLTNNCLDED